MSHTRLCQNPIPPFSILQHNHPFLSFLIYFPAPHHSRWPVNFPQILLIVQAHFSPFLTQSHMWKQHCLSVCVTWKKKGRALPVSFHNLSMERNINEKQRQPTHRSTASWFTVWLTWEECVGRGSTELLISLFVGSVFWSPGSGLRRCIFRKNIPLFGIAFRAGFRPQSWKFVCVKAWMEGAVSRWQTLWWHLRSAS